MTHFYIIQKASLWKWPCERVAIEFKRHFTILQYALYYITTEYYVTGNTTVFYIEIHVSIFKTYLRLDVIFFAVLIKPSNINLAIKMTNITDDGIFLHLHEVFFGDDSTATSWCNKDLSLGGSFFHGNNFISYERRGKYITISHFKVQKVTEPNFSPQTAPSYGHLFIKTFLSVSQPLPLLWTTLW